MLSGQKPWSVFGLAPRFQHRHMKAKMLEKYPNLLQVHKPDWATDVIAFIVDHLLDLSFLEDHVGPSSNQAEELHRTDQENLPLSTFLTQGRQPALTPSAQGVKLPSGSSAPGHLPPSLPPAQERIPHTTPFVPEHQPPPTSSALEHQEISSIPLSTAGHQPPLTPSVQGNQPLMTSSGSCHQLPLLAGTPSAYNFALHA